MGYVFKDRFLNKVMIITGAATGIGREAAIRAAKLVLVDRKEKEGMETLIEIKEITENVEFLILDLTDPKSSQKMVEVAKNKFGGLDIAINNAGVMGQPAPVHLSEKEQMDYTMENNFYTVWSYVNILDIKSQTFLCYTSS